MIIPCKRIPKPFVDYKLLIREADTDGWYWFVYSRNTNFTGFEHKGNRKPERKFDYLEEAIEYCHSLDYSFAIGSYYNSKPVFYLEVGERSEAPYRYQCAYSLDKFIKRLMKKYDLQNEEATLIAKSILCAGSSKIQTLWFNTYLETFTAENDLCCKSDSCYAVDEDGSQIYCDEQCELTFLNSVENRQYIIENYNSFSREEKKYFLDCIQNWYVNNIKPIVNSKEKLANMLIEDLAIK